MVRPRSLAGVLNLFGQSLEHGTGAKKRGQRNNQYPPLGPPWLVKGRCWWAPFTALAQTPDPNGRRTRTAPSILAESHQNTRGECCFCTFFVFATLHDDPKCMWRGFQSGCIYRRARERQRCVCVCLCGGIFPVTSSRWNPGVLLGVRIWIARFRTLRCILDVSAIWIGLTFICWVLQGT